MTDWGLPGRIESALAHFSLVGLAAILGNEMERSPRLWWTDEARPQALVSHDGTIESAASVVADHARRHVETLTWIRAVIDGGRRGGASLFTARGGWPGSAKGATRQEWHEFAAQRRSARNELVIDPLDEKLIAALGEPAWWRTGPRDERPDDGASRWEMKTRNRGEEFLANRLVLLGKAVADRSVEDVAHGLTGGLNQDETARNSPDSRTATGLTTPGPVDSALAWCALWGLSSTVTIARNVGPASPNNAHGASSSSGIPSDGRTHPIRAALPVFTRPVTAGRWSDVLSSRPFRDWTFESSVASPLRSEIAGGWLHEQGVRAVVEFPIRKAGSASAPERQLLAGQLRQVP